jgi:phospholipid/cholesterol/gamma-HCH transport system substrate-binding protein
VKFSIRFADQIVGTLVILALAILVVVIFMLGKSQRWFVRDHQYKTYFNSASGLSPNMAVQYKGFTLGHVKKIMLAEDDSVEVLFIIFDEHHHRVKEGSMVEIVVSPIGLGNSFNFYPGRGSEIMMEGSVIPSITSPQARQLIAMGLAERPESSDNIANIMNQVNTLLDTLNKSLSGAEGSQDLPLGEILNNLKEATADINDVVHDLSGKLSPILVNLETLSDQLAEPSGTVMSILDSEGPVFSGIADILESITGIMNSLDRVIEFIPERLPQITLLLSDVQSALSEAEKLITALNNNPLLRGGVPAPAQTGPGAASPRDLEF